MSNQPPDSQNPYGTQPTTAQSIGSSQSGAAYQGSEQSAGHPMAPLYQARGWMKLVGIVFIIIGIFYCLTIIGAIVGWLPILMGFKLVNASKKLKMGFDNRNTHALTAASKDIGTFFTIQGILMLIGCIISGIYLIVVFGVIFFGIFAGVSGNANF